MMGKTNDLLPILNSLEAELFMCGTTLLSEQTRAAYFLRTHTQPFALITQITSGALCLHADHVSYRVEAGQGLIIPPHLPYRLTLLDEEAVTHWINVDYAVFHYFSIFDFIEVPLVLPLRIGQQIGQLQSELLAITQPIHPFQDTSMMDAVKGKQILYALLEQVLSVSSYKSGTLEHMQSRKRFEPVIAYIENHLDKKIKITDLAKLMFLSTSHFHKAFQDAFSTSPLQYIQSRRLKKAQLLLVTSEVTMQEIARLIGYETGFAFTRFFKSLVGESPWHYRQSFRNQKKNE